MRCLELTRRSLLVGGGAAAAALHAGVAQARDPAAGHGPAGRPGLQADRPRRAGPVEGDGPGRGGDRGLEPADQRPEAHRLSAEHHRHGRRTGGEGFPHLSGAHPRLQRDDVPDRLRGRLLRPASAHAQRSPARRRHRPRIRPFPAPPHDPLVARRAAQDRHFRDRRDAGRSRRCRRRASISAIMSSWRSSAPSCRCSSYSRGMEAEADAMGARLIGRGRLPADGDVEHLAAADRRGKCQRALSRQAPRTRAACSTPIRRPTRAWPTSRPTRSN